MRSWVIRSTRGRRVLRREQRRSTRRPQGRTGLGDDAVQRGRDRARGDDGGDGPRRHQANPTGGDGCRDAAKIDQTHPPTLTRCRCVGGSLSKYAIAVCRRPGPCSSCFSSARFDCGVGSRFWAAAVSKPALARLDGRPAISRSRRSLRRSPRTG